MWTGNVSPVIRQKAKGSRPARNLARRAARRHALPGYPVEPRHLSADEIADYFSGDKIVCLRCGKNYRMLHMHLPNIHGIRADDYKGMYGLPWSGRGLTCSDTHSTKAAISKKRVQEFGRPINPNMPSAWHASGRRVGPVKRRAAQANIARASDMARDRYAQQGPGWFDAILARVAAGTPLTRACGKGLPGRCWVRKWLAEHPEDSTRLSAVIDGLSFTAQARMRSLGDKFTQAVVAKRAAGASDNQIARDLGVNWWTVRYVRRTQGNIPCPSAF